MDVYKDNPDAKIMVCVDLSCNDLSLILMALQSFRDQVGEDWRNRAIELDGTLKEAWYRANGVPS